MEDRRDFAEGDASRGEEYPVKEISKGESDRFRSRCGAVSPSLDRAEGEVGVKGRVMHVSDFARMRVRRPDRC